ncbi:hypothetical protein, partial [Bradyrhizobium sp.]|uniref:hypothetical protein n=1 Tax=Bradyrhizobium sp. TaxID=376 RepID=UPI003C549742
VCGGHVRKIGRRALPNNSSPQTKNVRHHAPEYVGPQLDQRDVHLHRDYLVDLQTLKQALQRFLR